MIKVSINKKQQKDIERFRSLASSKDSEKALMVLLSSEGEKVSQIAKALKRNPHTVRDWLKRYNKSLSVNNSYFSEGNNCSCHVKQGQIRLS